MRKQVMIFLWMIMLICLVGCRSKDNGIWKENYVDNTGGIVTETQVENVIDTDQDTKEGREEQERKQKRQQKESEEQNRKNKKEEELKPKLTMEELFILVKERRFNLGEIQYYPF